MKNLLFLFGAKDRVGPKEYFLIGFSLMLVKYIGECLAFWLAGGGLLTPLNFFSPFLSSRYPGYETLGDWFIPILILWSFPFIWIGFGMSVRRAADAGLSPWLATLFFVPGLNYFLMIALSFFPSSGQAHWKERTQHIEKINIFSALYVSLAVALAGALLTWFSANLLKTYSASFFIGTPFLLGAIQSFFLNRKNHLKVFDTAALVVTTVFITHLFIVLFALEGLICLAMSLPLSCAFACIGSFLGTMIARFGRPTSLGPMALIVMLPVSPVIETQLPQTHTDVVLSVIEINATPEQVWPNVVSFSVLPTSDYWLFKLGVAHPLRARIEGSGVGAVRHCEFSTGAFVEPITVWDQPVRLGFDVKYQPQPMKEVSFYDHVDAPHLHGYFRSKRGEFKLIRLPNGNTLLEGRTWYEMDIQPGWYWQIYGRWFIHKIHERVLEHVKNLSEKSI